MANLENTRRNSAIPALCATMLLSTVGVFGATLPSKPSQPWVDDKIATALDACLEAPAGSATTLSMRNCYKVARVRYDAALVLAFDKALKHVDSTTANRLRQSQATWVTFRSEVDAVSNAPWTSDRGTIVALQIDQSEMVSLRARILEIELVWPGFAEADEPLEIGAEMVK